MNVVSPKAETEKCGALPWGSHALQCMSPVFPQVSMEMDNFLLCQSLERLKKKKREREHLFGKEELVTEMLVVCRGHQSCHWPDTWDKPGTLCIFSCHPVAQVLRLSPPTAESLRPPLC